MLSQVQKYSVAGEGQEELMQEARIALYRAACTYLPKEGGVSFGFYARVCIRNALIDRLRQKEDVLSLSDCEIASLLLLDEEADPSDALVQDEERALLKKRICDLLSSYEMQILEDMLAGKKVHEIAVHLGKTEKSVSNAIYRLRAKLQEGLQPS